jgi:hypothetical protein
MAILGVAMSFSGNYQNQKTTKNQFTISFAHFAGNEKLKLDSATYKNELGQTFTLSNFKYYISNIHFKNSNGKDFTLNGSFLINEDEETTKQIIINSFPEGNYTSVDFIVGIDSIHNCSGAQSGALDPVNAMFWAWNTGYIFLKLEGRANASRSPGNFFEYHIGGYKQPTNSIRKISLDLSKSEIEVSHTLKIKVNILEILKTPTIIDFEKLSSVTDALNAGSIANNYMDMFEIMQNEK